MQNNTDIILSPESQSSGANVITPRKIELDDRLSKAQRWNRDIIQLLGFQANPIHLVLDVAAWVNGSAILLLLARLFNPLVLLWVLWVSILAGIVVTRTAPTLRLYAGVRMVLIIIGALAIL